VLELTTLDLITARTSNFCTGFKFGSLGEGEALVVLISPVGIIPDSML
jgi:hypothetical protein